MEGKLQPKRSALAVPLWDTPAGQRLRKRFTVVVAVFAATALVLLVLSLTGLQALSAARAYVGGEALWSKAQKDAVYHLRKYARGGEPDAWTAFRQAIEVNLGDRRARLALQQEPPDREAAHEGFLAGRNHPDDVPKMIWLFLWFDWFGPFGQALDIWEQGDAKIAELEGLGKRLRRAVEAGKTSREVNGEVDALLADLDRLNRELTRLEDAFSESIGAGSRQLQIWIFVLITAITVLLLGTGIGLSRWLARYVRVSSEALAESEQRYRALAENSPVGIWHITESGETVYVNPAMREILEAGESEPMEGVRYHRFFLPEGLETVDRQRPKRHAGEASTYEADLVGWKGSQRPVLVSGAPLLDAEGQLEGMIGTFVDISDRKQAEKLLQHQALHDPLTDLPNRTLFLRRLDEALERAREEGSLVAVIFLDLDRFKVINDSLGHGSGDQVLIRLAERLDKCLPEDDLVARLGGDEFAALLEHQTDRDSAIDKALRIAEAVEEMVSVDGTRLRLTASLGIALLRPAHETGQMLLRDADIAMYVAKRKGGGQYHVFDPLEDARETFQLHFETALWQAVDKGEMVLLYQPLVDLRGGRIAGIEALLRWQRKDGEPIPPTEFIPVAEETGAIVPIGRWVLQEAARQMSRWIERWPEENLWLSVNLSGRQVRRPELYDELAEILRTSGMPADRLCLEITESLLTQVPEHVARLKSLGCRVAIDDFGAGYSSLVALRQLAVDTLKIDRLFLADLGSDPQATELVRAGVQLAKALELEVVAEGVETAEQVELLCSMGCDLAQGFHFANPLAAEKLEDLLTTRPRW